MHDSVYILTAFFNLFIANFWVFYTLLNFLLYITFLIDPLTQSNSKKYKQTHQLNKTKFKTSIYACKYNLIITAILICAFLLGDNELWLRNSNALTGEWKQMKTI